MKKQTLFAAGEGGYLSYRIPAVICLPGDRVIAFCEGRIGGMSDYGTIHVVARISKDGGKTFGPAFVVAEDGENTVGNPAPVYDKDTGILHLLLNGNLAKGGEGEILHGKAPRTVLYTTSSDGGETWGTLRDLTVDVKQKNWTWYAMGPCHAQQLRDGRLLVPCNHAVLDDIQENSGPYISHTIYSDDHGNTWKLGEDVAEKTNECSLAEWVDGNVYMNMRSYHAQGCRAVAYSRDGGETWSEFHLDGMLPDPVCQGSVIASTAFGPEKTPALFFSNAADASERKNLTLRISRDAGVCWSAGTLLHEGPAAYSDIAILSRDQIGCLYECGESHPYERIEWAMLDAQELY